MPGRNPFIREFQPEIFKRKIDFILVSYTTTNLAPKKKIDQLGIRNFGTLDEVINGKAGGFDDVP